MASDRVFEMNFQPMTIEHLGLRLYSTLPPVISELVSNAYDAEAESVHITVPEGPIGLGAEVKVRDVGHGMNADELQNEYLPIGRGRSSTTMKERVSLPASRRAIAA